MNGGGTHDKKRRSRPNLRQGVTPIEKNVAVIDEFGRTAFNPGDFIDAVKFDKLDIALLMDDDIPRRSRDPRNDFGHI